MSTVTVVQTATAYKTITIPLTPEDLAFLRERGFVRDQDVPPTLVVWRYHERDEEERRIVYNVERGTFGVHANVDDGVHVVVSHKVDNVTSLVVAYSLAELRGWRRP